MVLGSEEILNRDYDSAGVEWTGRILGKITCHLEATTCRAGMCSSGMLAGGDQTVITHSINA